MYLAGKRIFIVEDNLENKTIAQMLLERAGAKVMIDRWGVDIANRLAKFAPLDAVLLDLMLPGQVTGYDVFKQIRQLEQFVHVPIAAISAADASTAIPKAQEMGFSGFISKPIDFQNFALQIKQIIDGESIWQTPERL
jgi:CheY-like chemotaxis protein